jgi:hypothetical protein
MEEEIAQQSLSADDSEPGNIVPSNPQDSVSFVL